MSVSFTMVKKGYNPVEVDNYIQNLENQLNDYREKASAINNAIINAQLAADNIIKEANAKSEKMLSSAEKDAQNMKLNAINQVKAMKSNITAQINLVNEFDAEYKKFIEKYLTPINNSEVSPLIAKLNSVNTLIDTFGDKVEKAALSKEPPEKPAVTVTAKPVATPQQPEPAPIQVQAVVSEQQKPVLEKTQQQPLNRTAPTAEQPKSASKPNSVLGQSEMPKGGFGLSGIAAMNAKNSFSDNSSMKNGLGAKTLSERSNPFQKKESTLSETSSKNSLSNSSESDNPFKKTESTPNTSEGEQNSLNPFSKTNSAEQKKDFGEELSVINENADYNSLMGEAGRGFHSPSAGTPAPQKSTATPSYPPKNSASSSNPAGVRPGIYKTSDLVKDSFSESPFASSISNDAGYSSDTFLTKSELDELMPTPKFKK